MGVCGWNFHPLRLCEPYPVVGCFPHPHLVPRRDRVQCACCRRTLSVSWWYWFLCAFMSMLLSTLSLLMLEHPVDETSDHNSQRVSVFHPHMVPLRRDGAQAPSFRLEVGDAAPSNFLVKWRLTRPHPLPVPPCGGGHSYMACCPRRPFRRQHVSALRGPQPRIISGHRGELRTPPP